MPAGTRMLAGVAVGGRVAAVGRSALLARPQVNPVVARLDAFITDELLRMLHCARRADVCARVHVPCVSPLPTSSYAARSTVRYHAPMQHDAWPALPYDAWKDTYATLHMWTQVVGKVALAQAPPLNHSWGSALQVTPRGLSTRTLPHGDRIVHDGVRLHRSCRSRSCHPTARRARCRSCRGPSRTSTAT